MFIVFLSLTLDEYEYNSQTLLAVQQSDLPMIQFSLNGEPLHDIAINRFRGTVYPSICLPAPVEEELKVKAVLAENEFQHMSPSAKYGPIIVCRSIV